MCYHIFLCRCQVRGPLDSLVLHSSEQSGKHSNSQDKINWLLSKTSASVGPEPKTWLPGAQAETQLSPENKGQHRGAGAAGGLCGHLTPGETWRTRTQEPSTEPVGWFLQTQASQEGEGWPFKMDVCAVTSAVRVNFQNLWDTASK